MSISTKYNFAAKRSSILCSAFSAVSLIAVFLLPSKLLASPRGVEFCELVSATDQSILSLRLPSRTTDCYVIYGESNGHPAAVLFYDKEGWDVTQPSKILAREPGVIVAILPKGIRISRVELSDIGRPEVEEIVEGLRQPSVQKQQE